MSIERDFDQKVDKMIEEGIIKKEDSVEDFYPALDHLIIESKKGEILNQTEEIESQISKIKNNSLFRDYFEKEENMSNVKSILQHLEGTIKKALEEPSKISRGILDKAIIQFRIYQESMETYRHELEERLNSSEELRSAIDIINELKGNIEKLRDELKETIRLSESDQKARKDGDITTSEN